MSTQALRGDILADESRDLLFHHARTANTFTDEPVTDEQLQAIYDLVKWAPTSMNIQPLRIVAVRTPQARQTLVDALSDGNKAKTLAAPLTLIVAADTQFHENLPTQFPHFPGAKDLFADNPERDQIAKMNATLQVGYLILGIRAGRRGLLPGGQRQDDRRHQRGQARQRCMDGPAAAAGLRRRRPHRVGTRLADCVEWRRTHAYVDTPHNQLYIGRDSRLP